MRRLAGVQIMWFTLLSMAEVASGCSMSLGSPVCGCLFRNTVTPVTPQCQVSYNGIGSNGFLFSSNVLLQTDLSSQTLNQAVPTQCFPVLLGKSYFDWWKSNRAEETCVDWRPLVSSPLPGTQECDSWGCSCLWWRTIQKHGYAGQSWYSWWAGTEDKVGSDLGREGRNDLDLGKIVSITSIKYSSQAHSLVFYSPIFYGRSVFNTETVSLLHLKCFHNFFEQKDADFGCDFIWSSWWTCPWRVRRQGKMLYLDE